MATFTALAPRGLLEPLAEELGQLGIKSPNVRPFGVEFDATWAELYRLHLESRLASRFLLPVADFTAYNEEDLYHGVLRQHDFTKYIGIEKTFRVEAHARGSLKLRDQRFVALKTKDAIADQFRAKYGTRPNVGDEASADLRIVVRVVDTTVSLALDLTGDPLSNRGYRKLVGTAPLRENVAAGILRLAGWTAPRPLVDPFCGSGTILIEAALSAVGQVASKRRRQFAFERLNNFDATAWDKLTTVATRKASPAMPFLFGYDIDGTVIEKARENARAAGVENWIRFQRRDVGELTAPAGVTEGLIVTNPPYGERMSSPSEVRGLMDKFSATLKRNFVGWDAWVLSGNREQSEAMRLKATRRAPVWNGTIECRLLKYTMEAGSGDHTPLTHARPPRIERRDDAEPSDWETTDADARPRIERPTNTEQRPGFARPLNSDRRPRFEKPSNGESRPRVERASGMGQRPRFGRSADTDKRPRFERTPPRGGSFAPRADRRGPSIEKAGGASNDRPAPRDRSRAPSRVVKSSPRVIRPVR